MPFSPSHFSCLLPLPKNNLLSTKVWLRLTFFHECFITNPHLIPQNVIVTTPCTSGNEECVLCRKPRLMPGQQNQDSMHQLSNWLALDSHWATTSPWAHSCPLERGDPSLHSCPQKPWYKSLLWGSPAAWSEASPYLLLLQFLLRKMEIIVPPQLGCSRNKEK